MSVPVYYVAEADDEEAPVGSIGFVKSGYVVGSERAVREWAEDEFGAYEMKQKQFYVVSDGETDVVVASNDLQDATEHAVEEHGIEAKSVTMVEEVTDSAVSEVEFDRKFGLTHGLTKLD